MREPIFSTQWAVLDAAVAVIGDEEEEEEEKVDMLLRLHNQNLNIEKGITKILTAPLLECSLSLNIFKEKP